MKNDKLIAAIFFILLLASLGAWTPGLLGAILMAALTYYIGSTLRNQHNVRMQPKRVLAVQPVRIYRRRR